MIKSVFDKIFRRKTKDKKTIKETKNINNMVNSFREPRNNVSIEYNQANSCENKEVNVSFNGTTKFDIEENIFNNPKKEFYSKRMFLKTQDSKKEYIEDQLNTLLINLKLISENIPEEHPESNDIQDLITIIINQSSTKLLLTKEKSDILTKILLSKQIEQEIKRESYEKDLELSKEINIIKENVKVKEENILQACDLFAEFEKALNLIRVSYSKYENFIFNDFLQENYKLLIKKNKNKIEIRALCQFYKNKNNEISDLNIYIRSLELWKGIQVQYMNRKDTCHIEQSSIEIIQRYYYSLFNKITFIEHMILVMSLIYNQISKLGTKSHDFEYFIEKLFDYQQNNENE
jgi:hypothetical protein